MSALVRLFAYNYWANSRVIDMLLRREISDDRILRWTNHTINMEEMWLSRITEEPSTISLNTYRPLSALLIKTQELYQAYRPLVELRTEEQLQSLVSYRNERGMAFSTSLEDILAHVINHSTHHRGQIVARMRETGIVPPVTDYIHFLQYAKA